VRILTLVTLLALAVVAAGTASTTAFRGSVTAIGPERAAAMTGVSWRAGCPVSLRDLRLVTATYRDFSGRARTGWLVVHRDVAADVLGVLRRLYAAGFPIRRMIPIDAYGGSDFRSIEADNTSAFNCRPVDGTNTWSEHAYGRAIDVNPIENPYVSGGRTSHPASVPYVDRVPCRKGMACPGNRLVAAFRAIGWGWGGDWSSARDYQHFSSSSR
jgi:D-alanyl-D-alanine carboxypeptidase